MALSVSWSAKVINVLKADLLLVQAAPTEIRQLDIDAFRLDLRELEAEEAGVSFLRTHTHNPPVTVGGVTLARVVEIINDYTVTFEDGQYAVNLVGANSNIGDVTNVNQVSIRSANSAGLTFSEQINDQSFLGKIWIDTADGLSGSQFPRGTPTDPVDNFADASIIAAARKLKEFHVMGAIAPVSSIARQTFTGYSHRLGSITLDGILDTTDAVFEKLTVSGTMNGACAFDKCAVDIVGGFEGTLTSCAFIQSLELDPLTTEKLRLISCYSDIAGDLRPTLDLNGADAPINIRDYSGGLTIENMTAGNKMSLDCNSATIEIAASCTSGTINVRGIGFLIDNSGPGCTVLTNGLIEPEDLRLARDHARASNQQTQTP